MNRVWEYVKDLGRQAWTWLTKTTKQVEGLVGTEGGYEMYKRVTPGLIQAAITVAAIQMSMAGTGISMVSVFILVGSFMALFLWGAKARNDVLQGKV